MSFADYEGSRDRGEPVNLFLFEYGPDASHRIGMTDAENVITYDGTPYIPEPILRDTIKASGTLDKSMFELRSDRDNAVAELFRIYPPSQVVRLTIYQGHLDDPARQFLVVWTGRVLNVKWEGSECRLSCEPIATSLRRPGLRRRYQLSCPHVLYGSKCRANKEAATSEVTINTKAEGVRSVMVNYQLEGDDPRTLRGGTLEWITPDGLSESRTIMSVSGSGATTTLLLTGVVRSLPAGYAVNLVRGCSHTMDDCGNLHNNLPNFGGMPWIPTKNPVGRYSPYY